MRQQHNSKEDCLCFCKVLFVYIKNNIFPHRQPQREEGYVTFLTPKFMNNTYRAPTFNTKSSIVYKRKAPLNTTLSLVQNNNKYC